MTTTASAIDLPPERAIEWLRAKVNATSSDWTTVWQRANARAFTVAGAATDALVEDFRTSVAAALENGTTLADFRKDFDAIAAKHGWMHSGTPAFRSQMIFETNLSMAYSAGRYAEQVEPAVLEAYPYWQYVHSGSPHPRHQHLAWDGLILRADDPWWSTHYPPNGWRCGCWVRPVSARDLARMGRSGPDTAPKIEYRDWTNRKTGEVHKVPVGIDPGFDYNPGEEWQGKAKIPDYATLKAPGPVGPPSPAAPIPKLPSAAKPVVPDNGPVAIEPPSSPVAGSPIPAIARSADDLRVLDELLTSDGAEWANSLGAAEKRALLSYRGADGFVINQRMRRGEPLERFAQEVDTLTAALNRASLKRPVRIFRGEGGLSTNVNAEVGDIISNSSFVSASIDQQMAFEMGADGVIMEVDLPVGYPAAYVNRVPRPSAEPEYEMLLPPGRRFRVVERTGNRLRLEVDDG